MKRPRVPKLREENQVARLTDARRDLIARNIKFAKYKALPYLLAFPGHGAGILSAAHYGMCRAALTWKDDGRAKFTTYSAYAIRTHILRFLRTEIDRPEILTPFRAEDEEWLAEDDRQLTYISDIRMDLFEFLDRIPPREKQVLVLRIFNLLTLKEIGRIMNLTRERVRQIESRAIRDLRHQTPDLKDYR